MLGSTGIYTYTDHTHSLSHTHTHTLSHTHTQVFTDTKEVHADSVIVATGASARRLHFAGADEFWMKGISACAICDGASPHVRNHEVAVVGGGDAAMEEAMFLSRYASKVGFCLEVWLRRRWRSGGGKRLRMCRMGLQDDSHRSCVDLQKAAASRGLCSHCCMRLASKPALRSAGSCSFVWV